MVPEVFEAPHPAEETPLTGVDSTGEVEAEDLPEEPKKIGKPPKARSPVIEPFPKPPRTPTKGGYLTGEKFFNYWKSLPKYCADRVLVYMYREYPKMNYMLALTPEEQDDVLKKRRRPPTKNIGKFSEPFASNDWRDELLRRFGEGDYKLILNDSGMKASTPYAQNICKAWIELRDEEYPPVIEDLRCVDPNDPVNQSYLKKLEMAGMLNRPAAPQENTPEENEDMALSTVVKDLSDKMIQMAERPQREAPAAAPTPSSEAAEIVGTAAKEGINIVVQALKSAQEHQTKAQDPKAYMQDVMETARALQPPNNGGGNDAIVQLLMKQMEMAEARHARESDAAEKRHERDIALIRENHTQQLHAIEERIKLIVPTPNTEAKTSEMKMLDNMLSIKEKLDALSGGANESGIPGWIPYALQGVKILGDVATNFMHNAAVARSGQGQPLAPPETSAELPEGGDDGMEEVNQNALATYARQIHMPMKDALTKKMHGSEFGARICLQLGNTTAYDFLQSQGREGLLNLLQAAPEVWGTFQQFGQSGQNVIFLDQFLDRDAVYQAIEDIKERAKPKPYTPSGRTVIGADGKPVKTAGPVVNTSAEPA